MQKEDIMRISANAKYTLGKSVHGHIPCILHYLSDRPSLAMFNFNNRSVIVLTKTTAERLE